MKTTSHLLFAGLAITATITWAHSTESQELTLKEELTQRQWQNRVLLINTKSRDKLPKIPAKLFEELKLHSLILNGNTVYSLGANGAIEKTSIKKASETRFNHQNQVWLIGLDGGVKANYSLKDFNVAIMTEFINTMPMRQWELNSTNQQNNQ